MNNRVPLTAEEQQRRAAALSRSFPTAEIPSILECERQNGKQDDRKIVFEESSADKVATGAHSPSPMTSDRLRPLDLKQFLQLSIKTRQMLLDPILPEKGLAMLYAARGTGKTHLALGICFAVATGTKFLKWVAPKPRRVLLIDGEMPAGALQERLAGIVASAPGIQLDPDNIKILAGDLIEVGGISARFEVHLEKARGVHGDAATPFEARLEVRDGAAVWTTRELEDANRARVQTLLDDGLSVREIADETGIPKSTVHRIKKAIEAMGGDGHAE